MSYVLRLEICIKSTDIRILKELSRKELRPKFGSNKLCLSFLSDIKWGMGALIARIICTQKEKNI